MSRSECPRVDRVRSYMAWLCTSTALVVAMIVMARVLHHFSRSTRTVTASLTAREVAFGCLTARKVPFGCVIAREVALGCLIACEVAFGRVTVRAARCGAARCGAARC